MTPPAIILAALLSVSAPGARDTLHLLFVGNSFTYYHNMPAMLESLSVARSGPVLSTQLVAHGGATLTDHWNDTLTRKALAGRHWDWVIFNEQSTFGDVYLVDGRNRVHSSKQFAESATRFADLVRAQGGKPAFIGHWADLGSPHRDQIALDFAFDSITRGLHSTLIPASAAWQSDSAPAELYDADHHHPSPAGSYLIASLIYATITGRTPVGGPSVVGGPLVEEDDGVVHPDSIVPLVALDPPTAHRLQALAWRVHRQMSSRSGTASRPPAIVLPSLPRSTARLSPAMLLGTWTGTTTLYPSSTPAALELRIQAGGDGLRGTLVRVLGPGPDGREQSEVTVTIRGVTVTVVDAKGPNGGTVRYVGVLRNGGLEGVADFLIPTPGLYGIGSWRMTLTTPGAE